MVFVNAEGHFKIVPTFDRTFAERKQKYWDCLKMDVSQQCLTCLAMLDHVGWNLAYLSNFDRTSSRPCSCPENNWLCWSCSNARPNIHAIKAYVHTFILTTVRRECKHRLLITKTVYRIILAWRSRVSKLLEHFFLSQAVRLRLALAMSRIYYIVCTER